MASDPSIPVNGNYATHAGYLLPDQSYGSHAISSSGPTTADYGGSSTAPTSTGEGNGTKTEIPKDEVGWYFVEQYYTNLGKSPEKLYLFYTKQSQFVSGDEAQKVPVSVGQKAINERIKELGFHDARVRVSNVDSQGSGANIVIQVIGDISNNSQPHRKFTQTFVLAEQTNGYFVLNDIFRYIVDEEDVPQEEVPNVGGDTFEDTTTSDLQGAGGDLKNAADVGVQEMDATTVDQGLPKAADDQTMTTDSHPELDVDGGDASSVPEAVADEIVAVAPESQEETSNPTVSTSEAVELVSSEPIVQSEKPKAPESTPVAASPIPTQPAVAAPAAKPAVPKTWAALAAGANKTASPAASATSSTTPAPTASARVLPPPLIQPQATPAAGSQSIDPESPVTPQSGSEWQTAGHDHGKRQARPQPASTTADENYRGYIKHVSEHIEVQALKTALLKAAEVSYVDINRQKNCAFVDFASPAAYRAAVAANPHDVSGEQMYVEERRVRNQGYTGTYGPSRGGAGRGRGGPDNRGGTQGRGGFPRDGARGGFPNRGRGGNGNARGRGVSSAT